MQIYTTTKQKRFLRPIIFTILLTSIGVFGTVILLQYNKREPIISPVSVYATNSTPVQRTLTFKQRDKEKLKTIITQALDDSIPESSIVVDDFLSNFHLEMGEQVPYTAASVNKLYILVALFTKIQQGTISPSQKITLRDEDRQEGTGPIQYDPTGSQYTVGELTQAMMQKSDNSAAHILATRVLDFSDIQTMVMGWGMKETNMDDNTTSNLDTDMLFRKLFTGKLLSASYTRQAIDLLANSDFEDRIPALLPKDTRIYHKIGNAIGSIHDVGVIVDDKTLYYIGILTRNVSEEERATKAMARVSKAVYDFMNEE